MATLKDQDALRFACTSCAALASEWCVTKTGKNASKLHADRYAVAREAGRKLLRAKQKEAAALALDDARRAAKSPPVVQTPGARFTTFAGMTPTERAVDMMQRHGNERANILANTRYTQTTNPQRSAHYAATIAEIGRLTQEAIKREAERVALAEEIVEEQRREANRLKSVAQLGPLPEVTAAIAEFPAEFRMEGYTATFRISPTASYVDDSDRVILYTQRLMDDGVWRDFAKGTVKELRAKIRLIGLDVRKALADEREGQRREAERQRKVPNAAAVSVHGGERKRDSGRYAVEQRCDACSMPITVATGGHFTDDRECKGGDGPGFFLCGRSRCVAKREALDSNPTELRALYAAGRAKNDARDAGRKARAQAAAALAAVPEIKRPHRGSFIHTEADKVAPPIVEAVEAIGRPALVAGYKRAAKRMGDERLTDAECEAAKRERDAYQTLIDAFDKAAAQAAPVEEIDEQAESPILCGPCHGRQGEMSKQFNHRGCGQAGCECHCNRLRPRRPASEGGSVRAQLARLIAGVALLALAVGCVEEEPAEMTCAQYAAITDPVDVPRECGFSGYGYVVPGISYYDEQADMTWTQTVYRRSDTGEIGTYGQLDQWTAGCYWFACSEER